MLNEKDSKRFWAKVDKTNSCWNWTAAKGAKGYGRFKLNGKLVSPHVISYRLHYDDYDNSKYVCHKCDNPSCVNPDHLFLGTPSDNMKDCLNKGRLQIPKLKGVDNPSSKLSEEDVREIKKLFYVHSGNLVIAKMFGVNKETIRCIRLGKTWSHI